jgi:hypothetical protein
MILPSALNSTCDYAKVIANKQSTKSVLSILFSRYSIDINIDQIIKKIFQKAQQKSVNLLFSFLKKSR